MLPFFLKKIKGDDFMEEFVPFSISNMKKGIKINDSALSIKLIDENADDTNKIVGVYKIMVCIDNTPISICKTIPIDIIKEQYIDMDDLLKNSKSNKIQIEPNTDFWVSYSSIQAWVENNYNPTVIHSVLANQLIIELMKRNHNEIIDQFLAEMEKYFMPENEEWLNRFIIVSTQSNFVLIVNMLKYYDIGKRNNIYRLIVKNDGKFFIEMMDDEYILKMISKINFITYDEFYENLLDNYTSLMINQKVEFNINLLSKEKYIVKPISQFMMYKNISIHQINNLIKNGERKINEDFDINKILFVQSKYKAYIAIPENKLYRLIPIYYEV